ncbi:O-antigen ligase family protein [Kallotenue papyrolyticum]|uniref:O-antigen ligase family protein n=1 Tax=Kallotenue papyrolyticum TaxID=1325125 RepID=UPI0004786228|nr:O-antigen ligase family protein [Kallotenue papyrolyticum]
MQRAQMFSGPAWPRLALAGGLLLTALLLAWLPWWLAAALILVPLLVGLIVLEPALGLYAAILSVPVQETVRLPTGLTVTQVVVVLAFGAWLLRLLAHPERSPRLWLLGPWLVLLGVLLASAVLSPYSRLEALLQFARWVASLLAFILTLGTISTRHRLWGLVAALLLGPLIAALIGLVQFVVPSTAPESFLILGERFARASATFGKPNPFAGYLNMAWPLALALAIFYAHRALVRTAWRLHATLLALLFGGATLVLLAGLFASYSRGGWLGASVGLLTLALAGGRRTTLLAGLGVLLALLVGLLGAFRVLPPAFTDRLTPVVENLRIFDAGEVAITDDNFAIVERMAHWQAGWRMWQAHPLLGVGVGNYNTAYRDFYVAPWAISQGHAHNYYIHMLAESGLLGLLAYLGLIGAMAYAAIRARQQGNGTVWGAAAAGVCGIIAAVAGHNVFENLHVLNMGIQLSGVWGLAIIAPRLKSEGDA